MDNTPAIGLESRWKVSFPRFMQINDAEGLVVRNVTIDELFRENVRTKRDFVREGVSFHFVPGENVVELKIDHLSGQVAWSDLYFGSGANG